MVGTPGRLHQGDRQKGVLPRTARPHARCCALNPARSSAPGPQPRMNLPVLVLAWASRVRDKREREARKCQGN